MPLAATVPNSTIPTPPSTGAGMETPLEAARNKRDLAREARCDVALHGSVITWDETVPAQLDELAAMGIRSVKMYMTNRGSTMSDNDTVLRVMKEMRRLGGLTIIHAEHDAIIVDCTEEHADAGRIGIEHLHHTRPELAEARTRGVEAYSETCPHYLLLDDGVYASRYPEWFACCPPMRSAETVAALRERFADGSVDTLSSDHSCYDLTQKRERTDDVREMPHGLPGVETRMPAGFTALAGDAPADDAVLARFADLFSAGPARIHGLAGKGRIAAGFDADLVIFDPDESRRVDGGALHMGTDFSPFNGRMLRGWPQAVIAAGRVVLDEDGFHDPGAVGRLIGRHAQGEDAARADAEPVLAGRGA
ncbi:MULTISPECIES: dihydroorotase [Microbacterium]|uniref:dihydroorotase n=1 Tax=Microbacterium TaxID=33882 RepID=UPI00217EC957|nr:MULTISPECIES: amidohydrolase family protein [Microbacterium]